MMKVLWLTSFVMPDHAATLGYSPSPRSGWLPALAAALKGSGEIELGVATNIPDSDRHQSEVNGVRYYSLPCPRIIYSNRLPISLVKEYQNVIEDFRPDIIHIHGTEYFHGLLTGHNYINCPVVISIQGILDVYQRHYFGGMSFSEIMSMRTIRDWGLMDGLMEQKLRWARRAKLEREVFANNKAFIGRTEWDKAHTLRLNPKARYYHCDEAIRQPFHDVRWDIHHVKRHSIFASSASYPLKGFHVLIKAAAILRKDFPDITIRSPLLNLYSELTGVKRFLRNCRVRGYDRYVNDLVRAEGLQENVSSLSTLDANGMANELRKAHVFVLPSLIENSPNSLAEAMLVGTPSIASFVGGVPSMVRDDYSVLMFPPGDEAVLAEQIRRIFLDEELALDLSRRAHDIALARHSKERIADTMLNIYRQEISAGKEVKMSMV